MSTTFGGNQFYRPVDLVHDTEYPVPASLAESIGDLLYWDTVNLVAKPVSQLALGASQAADQLTIAQNFLGIAGQARLATDSTTGKVIVVYADIPQYLACDSQTWEAGDLVAVERNAGATALLDQQVMKVTSRTLAIGYVVQREPNAVTKVRCLLFGKTSIIGQFMMINPGLFSSVQEQFGSGLGTMLEEGNLNRQIFPVAAPSNPGATGADNVVAVYSLPANSLDGLVNTNRGLTIEAIGTFAANGNNKRAKLFWNPATAVVGQTIGAGGTLLADTGTTAQNAGSFWLGGNVFKRGAANSNTQLCTSNGAVVAGTHQGISPAVDATAVENAAILIAVTINNTTAVGDCGLNLFTVNGMN